ncbi:MAG: geranylgeranylglycerol-phosphate geranylgeranyltransferase [Candidatus Lokiarchaeota archaeon]|nr:geranylgeranylglycerol-phosphate geranylgeranyltransferase [Candidatus Lokiarchaeota archaeon]
MKFKDTIEILRPINGLMGGLTVIIGILNTRIDIDLFTLVFNIIFGILTYFFISGSSMVINDYYDIEIDKINRPERPIPRGSITLKQAKILWIITILIGTILSIIHSLLFNIGYLVPIIVVFMAFIGWLYAAWGKKSGFLGNIIVGVSFSIGLIYGAMLNNSFIPPYIYYFFLTSFFLLLSREVIKGCEDVEGDKNEGVRTLAIRIGIKKSTMVSMIFAIIAIVFYILPLFTVINQLLFLISMVFGLAVVLFAVILMLKGNLVNKDFKKVSLLLKIGAFLGLLTFLLASF